MIGVPCRAVPRPVTGDLSRAGLTRRPKSSRVSPHVKGRSRLHRCLHPCARCHYVPGTPTYSLAAHRFDELPRAGARHVYSTYGEGTRREALMRKRIVPAIAAAVLGLGACTSDGPGPEPTETQPSGPGATTAPSEAEDTSPSPESPDHAEGTDQNGDNAQDQNESEGEPGVNEDALADFSEDAQVSGNWDDFTLEVDHDTIQVLSEIRHGVHDGYERAVLEFSEDTALAYRAEYVELRTDAGAVLAVEIKGTTGGPEAEEAARLDRWETSTGETALLFIDPQPLEGGESVVHIGTEAERFFRIHHAADPTRIIIDVATQ